MLSKKAVRLKIPDELYKRFKEKHAAEGFTGPEIIEKLILDRKKNNRKPPKDLPLPEKFYTATFIHINQYIYDELEKMAEKHGESVSRFASKMVCEYLDK